MVRFVLESGTLRPGTLRQWYASSDIQNKYGGLNYYFRLSVLPGKDVIKCKDR